MIRPLVQSARCAMRSIAHRGLPLARPAAASSFLQSQGFAPVTSAFAVRGYASGGSLSKQEVEGRILDLLKGFDKIKDSSKISQESHFANDLGLDSLDTVEVVMAIEEEFSIEIPDKEADAIHTVDKAINYVIAQPDAH